MSASNSDAATVPAAVVQAATRLMDAASSGTSCQPVRELLAPLGLDAAYRTQRLVNEVREKAGARVIGHKIGLTSTAVQRQLGVEQPDYGLLFDDMAFGDEQEIPLARLLQPKIEAEIAFVLERDLLRERPSLAEVISATAYVVPAIEIVDSRIADWKISIHDTIADNASSGLFVLGASARKLDRIDLRLCGVSLENRGEPVSVGCGAACLGNPLNALAWLAHTRVMVGRPLRAGDVILSGALGPMVSVKAGEMYEARISGLGRVAAAFI